MNEPVCVSVVALDPVLEAGVTSALQCCPDIALGGPADVVSVAVVVVDGVSRQVLEVVRATRNAPHRPEVVLMASDLAPGEMLDAIAAGARGLLRRREAGEARLVRTVLAADAGDCTVPPDLVDGLLEHAADTSSMTAALADWAGPGLGDRERAVLSLVADGRETEEIARELCYSTRTVTSVVHDITHRFRLRNRAHAVAYALRAGLL
jgi:DNA-binding NarL/FixJ family response regulator